MLYFLRMRDFKNPEKFLAGGGKRLLPYSSGRGSRLSESHRKGEPVRTSYHADTDAQGNPIFDKPRPPKASAFRDERMAAQRDEALRITHDAYFAKSGQVIPVAPPFLDENEWRHDPFISDEYPSSKSARDKLTYSPHRIPREQEGDGHLSDRRLDRQYQESIRGLRAQRDADLDKLLDEIHREVGSQELLPDFVPQRAELVPTKGMSSLKSRLRHAAPDNDVLTRTQLAQRLETRAAGSDGYEREDGDKREKLIDQRSRSEQWSDRYEEEGEDAVAVARGKMLSSENKDKADWRARRYGEDEREVNAYRHARRNMGADALATERDLYSRVQAIDDERARLSAMKRDLLDRRTNALSEGDGKTHAATYREASSIDRALADISDRSKQASRDWSAFSEQQVRPVAHAYKRRLRHPKHTKKSEKPRGDGQSPRNAPPRLFDDRDF